MGKIIIDTDICFECGEPKEEMHHVIPKSKGGEKTIPLCIDCHGKAHDVSYRRLMLDSLIDTAEAEIKEMDRIFDESDLPKGIDPELVNKLLIKIRREFYHL